jgi:protein TonB
MTDHIFGDVLLETTATERRRRKLTLLATVAGEALVVATLVAIPLLYLDALPGVSVHAAPVTTPLQKMPAVEVSGGSRTAGEHSVVLARATDEYVVRRTVQDPQLIFNRYRDDSDETTTDPRLTNSNACCSSPVNEMIAAAPRPVVGPPPHRPVISNLQPGMVLQRVEPVYPAIAKQIHLQGEVVLRATVSKEGTVESLQVVSGHPLLTRAALDAVSQWRFRPYQLNGAPIEVDAQITVRFVLGGQ